MLFQCPQCNRNTLKILSAMELIPIAAADEVTIQIAECGLCRFQTAAVYEESRGGALQGESSAHQGYPLNAEKFQLLSGLFKECPDRFRRTCTCHAHRELAQQASRKNNSVFFQQKPFFMKPGAGE